MILGAYFTARTLKLNQEGHRLNQEGQITERFTRAVEQLANDKLDIRLGGIYALERIAHDSETHYEPVMEALTAFLREHAPWAPSAAPMDEYSEPWEVPALRVDFQIVATVLGRRDRRHERNRLYLRRVDLRRASLDLANFSHANFSEANLSWADLSEANLSGANLRGATLTRADLGGADLSGATGLTQQQLDDTLVTDEGTKLPAGFVLPARL